MLQLAYTCVNRHRCFKYDNSQTIKFNKHLQYLLSRKNYYSSPFFSLASWYHLSEPNSLTDLVILQLVSRSVEYLELLSLQLLRLYLSQEQLLPSDDNASVRLIREDP